MKNLQNPKEDSKRSMEDRITLRACLMKAKMRAMLWGVSYQRSTMMIPDITELRRSLEEAFRQAQDSQSPAGN
jgi:hypothetical protein